MNEMRKLMETIKRIAEDDFDMHEELRLKYGLNAQVLLAYDDDGEIGGTQNLDVRGGPVSLQEWHDIMVKALNLGEFGDGTYNNFNPRQVAQTLSKFPGSHDYRYIPGRESSVVLYIVGAPDNDLRPLASYITKNRGEMSRVDEINIYKDGREDIEESTLRLWWD